MPGRNKMAQAAWVRADPPVMEAKPSRESR